MRSFVIAANWKMNGDIEVVTRLLRELNEELRSRHCDLIFAPAYVHISLVKKKLEIRNASLAGQNCSEYSNGAFTGEISARMLVDLGCNWVILGHSERRQNYGETNEIVASKIRVAVSAGLGVILCVGETLDQRDSGDADSVVFEQIISSLDGTINDDSKIMIAYEPVWAIGTGVTATPEQAQTMHSFIRKNLQKIDCIRADYTPILYGGSVKSTNALDLFNQEDIDGALVGGASLDAKEFSNIVRLAS